MKRAFAVAFPTHIAAVDEIPDAVTVIVIAPVAVEPATKLISPFASVTNVREDERRLPDPTKYPPELIVTVVITPTAAAPADVVALNLNATSSFVVEPESEITPDKSRASLISSRVPDAL